MNKEQKESILNSIDGVLNDFFKSETVVEEVVVEAKPEVKADVVEKSFDEVNDSKADGTDIKLDANGGGDVIKNKDEKNKAIDKIKKEADPEDDDEDEKKKKKAKKSFEVSEAQYDRLQKAMKEDEDKAKAEALENDPILKSVNSNFTALSEQIKTLNEKVETLSKSPARQPKGLNGLQPLEKSATGEVTGQKKLMKSQVLPVLLEMQEKGLVDSAVVCEYEYSGNILDTVIKSQVANELTKRGLL